MSGIIGSKLNHRGSGLVGSLGTDGQHLLSAGAGKTNVFETVADSTYDDEPLRADLTALALREATNEASAAFNLPNSFIETFTDDTNLGTQTDGDRVSGYWTTIYTSVGAFSNDGNTMLLLHGDGSDASTTITDSSSNSYTWTAYTGAELDTAQKKFGTASIYFDGSSRIECADSDWDSEFGTDDFTLECWIRFQSVSAPNTQQYLVSKGGSGEITTNYHGWHLRLNTATILEFVHWTSGAGTRDVLLTTPTYTYVIDTWYHIAVTKDSSDNYYIYRDGVSLSLTGTNPDSSTLDNDASRNLKIGQPSDGAGVTNGNVHGWIDEYRISDNCRYPSGTTFTPNQLEVANATGTLIQSANTVASAKTVVGGTMLYKDNEGTATLGTDLKIYFSCNNGGAWTEAASYNAITPVYSTGIKQVRLGETTCTSGTGIIYKAVWANQASGSKETQLHGIGITY